MHEYSSYFSKQNDTVSKEIEMFEKFLKRLDPKDIQLKSKYQSFNDVHTYRKKNFIPLNSVSCTGSAVFSDGLENAEEEN
jgi:hypothetical protein